MSVIIINENVKYSPPPPCSCTIELRRRSQQRARHPRQFGYAEMHDPFVRDGFRLRGLLDDIGRARRTRQSRYPINGYISAVSAQSAAHLFHSFSATDIEKIEQNHCSTI
jgi:hypothetical protein